ncbi:MAG: non-ribosomal peptide synthetase, partial [Prevotella sp.]
LTYAEMDRYSNALAHQLIDYGVQPNDFVCVMLDRFKEFPLAVLSIHKAGAAYTPLDFEYPNERLSYMLENSESKVLITSHDVLEAKLAEGDFSTAAAKTFFIDDFMKNEECRMKNEEYAAAVDLSSPDGLAYMIYTSGSTGKPKGAMLHQAGLRNFIAVVIDMEQLTAEDRISGHRSFSFDAHIEDMYPVLTLGGSFHIMPTEIRKDLNDIRQFLIDHQITGGGYSTAMTSLLLNTFDDLPIRFTTGGGEKMDGVFSDHIEIINVYGPTECTDDTSYYSIAPGRRVENIPIGESVANNWNFIIDTAGNLVPQGVAGELCFAGIQVGRGYWRLPERTATSFVDCPFVKEDRWGRPVRMYHTGDLCRWNEDGQLEYISRIDTQVKLRGFRIELGEIESKALNIEGIRQAAAEVRKVMGNEHLVLYYTLDEGSSLSDEGIQLALATSSLADYMVPDVYMKLDVMPMTPNLKINRKALPIPEMKRATEYVAPVGETEELFCNIFSEVLKIPEVGATDNFFEIGGTSINAIKVIVEASKQGVQIVFNDLFDQKTPRALAAFVNGNDAENTSESDDLSEVNGQPSMVDGQPSTVSDQFAD